MTKLIIKMYFLNYSPIFMWESTNISYHNDY